MSTWQKWLREGDQYRKAAGNDSNRKPKFGVSIQYNIVSLALESYVMAILDYFNTMPDNHTFTDFVEALEKVIPLDPTLRERILRHEQIQKICSFTDYVREEATSEQIRDFKDAVGQIAALAHDICV